MGQKEAMERRMLQHGVKIINTSSSLTYGLADTEWERWLKYVPEEQKEKYNRLNFMPKNELTPADKRWLNKIDLESRVATYLSKKNLNYEEASELKKYMDNASMEGLIARKLTDEEYKLGKKIASNLIKELNVHELEDLYHEALDYYDELDMVPSFAIREIAKVVVKRSTERNNKIYAQKIRENEAMRQRSYINASNRTVC